MLPGHYGAWTGISHRGNNELSTSHYTRKDCLPWLIVYDLRYWQDCIQTSTLETKFMKERNPCQDFILVPDGRTAGLWCERSWVPISSSGKIGTSDAVGYLMSPKTQTELLAHTEAAIIVAQKQVVALAKGIERLRAAPTHERKDD